MELFLIFVVLTGAFSYVAYVYVKHRRVAIWVPLILLLSVAAPIVNEWETWQTEQLGSQVVTDVSEKKAGYLKCQRFFGAFFDARTSIRGSVSLDQPNEAFLKRSSCADLRSWLKSDKTNPSIEETTAVAILIHESVHVSGEFDESVTECLTQKQFIETVMKFKVPESVARSMLVRYVDEVYVNMPKKYQHSSDC